MAGSDTTDSHEPAASVTTEEEFRSALRDVVTAADENGVDVRGNWEVFDEEDELDWNIEVTGVLHRSRAQIRETGFPASSVVGAIADREEVDQTDLPPLYDAIGPDILETIHRADGGSRQTVTFEYAGYLVTVNSNGSVVIDE